MRNVHISAVFLTQKRKIYSISLGAVNWMAPRYIILSPPPPLSLSHTHTLSFSLSHLLLLWWWTVPCLPVILFSLTDRSFMSIRFHFLPQDSSRNGHTSTVQFPCYQWWNPTINISKTWFSGYSGVEKCKIQISMCDEFTDADIFLLNQVHLGYNFKIYFTLSLSLTHTHTRTLLLIESFVWCSV